MFDMYDDNQGLDFPELLTFKVFLVNTKRTKFPDIWTKKVVVQVSWKTNLLFSII